MALRAIKRGRNEVIRLQEARRVMCMIASELASTFVQTDNTFFKLEDREIFNKTVSRLRFTTFSFRYPGIVKVSYYAYEDHDGKITLYKSFGSLFKNQTTKWEKLDLIEDINEFRVEVLHHGKWIATWDTALSPFLPEAIKVTLSLNINNKEFTLSQTVYPHIGKPLF